MILLFLGGILAFAQSQKSGQDSQSLPLIELNLDFRNLVSDDRKEQISDEKVRSLIEKVNQVYSQCRVSFRTRKLLEVPASSLKINFPPQSEADLGIIGDQINPNGFGKSNEAFPITIAGNFLFFAPTHQVNLYALTWTWLNGPNNIGRMHSVIARQHLDGPSAVEITVHELGHFFLLPHTGIAGNIMASGFTISPEQCAQVRSVAETYYQALR